MVQTTISGKTTIQTTIV